MPSLVNVKFVHKGMILAREVWLRELLRKSDLDPTLLVVHNPRRNESSSSGSEAVWKN